MTITEYDLRMPEYRHINDDDFDLYEVRKDGKVVRKDRWETGFRNIVSAIGMARDEFEIDAVVDKVRDIMSEYRTMRASCSDRREWNAGDDDDFPEDYEVN